MPSSRLHSLKNIIPRASYHRPSPRGAIRIFEKIRKERSAVAPTKPKPAKKKKAKRKARRKKRRRTKEKASRKHVKERQEKAVVLVAKPPPPPPPPAETPAVEQKPVTSQLFQPRGESYPGEPSDVDEFSASEQPAFATDVGLGEESKTAEWVVTGAGIAASLIGSIFVVKAFATQGSSSGIDDTRRANTELTIGGVSLGLGAVAIGTGIYLLNKD